MKKRFTEVQTIGNLKEQQNREQKHTSLSGPILRRDMGRFYSAIDSLNRAPIVAA